MYPIISLKKARKYAEKLKKFAISNSPKDVQHIMLFTDQLFNKNDSMQSWFYLLNLLNVKTLKIDLL